MALGERYLSIGDYAAATASFYRAHGLGHDKTRLHAHAHWALLRAGWLRRSPRQVMTQFALFALVWLLAALPDLSPRSQERTLSSRFHHVLA